MAAGRRLGLDTELISRDDYGRLAEFDSLFIRETTNVNHHTYRFARRAAAEGLIVVDDPESILKCSNKVYLAELLDHHNIPTPTTCLVHRDNLESAFVEIGVPCVLKQPDGAFSQGVIRTDTSGAVFHRGEQDAYEVGYRGCAGVCADRFRLARRYFRQ